MRPRSFTIAKTVVALLPFALAATVALPGCDGTPASGVTCDTDLGQTDAGRKVRLFVETSNSLVVAANQIDADMQDACIGMAKDLQIPPAEYAPLIGTETNAGARARAACTRVNTEIQNILKNDIPTTAKLTIVYTPAVCTIDLEAQTKCVEECEPKTFVVTDYMCEPGHFYGQCSAQCTGSCTGSCDGQCTAACHGSCSGMCKGNCNGTCATKAADGSCNGMCTGTCNGTCDATCTGTCSGSCGGKCTGGCSGSCDAWVQPPKCTATQKQVTVDECHTTCESKAKFDAVCTAPSVYVTFDVTTLTPAHEAKVELLVKAIKNHYAQLLKVAARTGTTIGDSVAGFSVALTGVTTYANEVGAKAGLCVVDALSAVGKAATQVEVSASFSVMISASATASGSAAAQ